MVCRWHDAGTYDVNTKTGGPNGSIRMQEEYSHGSNNGLKIAIDFCGNSALLDCMDFEFVMGKHIF